MSLKLKLVELQPCSNLCDILLDDARHFCRVGMLRTFENFLDAEVMLSDVQICLAMFIDV